MFLLSLECLAYITRRAVLIDLKLQYKLFDVLRVDFVIFWKSAKMTSVVFDRPAVCGPHYFVALSAFFEHFFNVGKCDQDSHEAMQRAA